MWELLDEDETFELPDYHGEAMYVQDCWRARDRVKEQDAVRSLMKKMNIQILEHSSNRENTQFCGVSLLRPAPPRNLRLAPERFVLGAKGKFEPHTPEEQKRLMEDYAADFKGRKVVTYCHYCYEGLKLGGADVCHLAQLMF